MPALPRQARPWAALVALLLAMAVFGLCHRQDGQPAAGRPRPGAESLPEAAPTVVSEPARSDVRPAPVPEPALVVEAVDTSGAPVPTARIHGQGPRGFFRDARGRGEWERLFPGEWILSAEAVGFFPAEMPIQADAGPRQEVQIVMRPAGLIRGSFHTTLGRPMVGGQIWFLRPGEVHPPLPPDGEGLLFAHADRTGAFFSPPLPAGEYRLSVGPIGPGLMQDERSVLVAEGQTREVEIVLDRGVLLRVYLPGLEDDARARPRVGLALPERRGGRRFNTLLTRRALGGEPAEFPFVPRGQYVLLVETRHRGYWYTETPVEVTGEECLAIELRLPEGESQRRDRTHQPLPFRIVPDPQGFPEFRESGFRWLR